MQRDYPQVIMDIDRRPRPRVSIPWMPAWHSRSTGAPSRQEDRRADWLSLQAARLDILADSIQRSAMRKVH